MRKVSLLFAALILVACSNKLEGTYACGGDGVTLPIEFTSKGKINYFGVSEFDYAIEDKTIKVLAPQGTIIFGKIMDDGSIQSQAGLCKKKNN